MEQFMKNSVVRLIAGNAGAAGLMVGVPIVILLNAAQLISGPLALLSVAVLWFASVLLLQFARNGRLIPRSWLAVAFAPLPVMTAAFTIKYWQLGDLAWSLPFLAMTLGSVFVCTLMLREARRPKPELTPQPIVTKRRAGTSGPQWPADDDYPMPI